jgi:hypothetical protein
VNGYNALTGAKVKLGRWDEYLAMRDGVLRLTAEHQALLSNDLGAVAEFLFDLGEHSGTASGLDPLLWTPTERSLRCAPYAPHPPDKRCAGAPDEPTLS